MEIEQDANPTSEDENWIKVNIGSSRSSTIGSFWRQLDEFYSQRPDAGVQEQGDTVDEDPDIRPDSGIGSGSDAGDVDSGPGRETDDQGESDPSTEPIRASADDGTPGASSDVEESTGGTNVGEASTERTEPEGGQRESKQVDPRFYFAPLQHSRGDYLN